jgi:hypothetical protein
MLHPTARTAVTIVNQWHVLLKVPVPFSGVVENQHHDFSTGTAFLSREKAASRLHLLRDVFHLLSRKQGRKSRYDTSGANE